MSKVSPIVKVYEYNFFSFHKNLDDVNHQRSITQPPSYANTINWIAGHIVLNRDSILKHLGQEAMCSESFGEVYKSGNTVFNDGDATDIEKIVELYDKSQEIIIAAFSALDTRRQEHIEIIEKLAGYAFHEAYHVGQLGYARRLVGKKGALK